MLFLDHTPFVTVKQGQIIYNYVCVTKLISVDTRFWIALAHLVFTCSY